MGYKSLIEIHIAIFFNKQKRQQQASKTSSSPSCSTNKDKHNHTREEKTEIVSTTTSNCCFNSSTSRHNPVLVVQPETREYGAAIHFFIVDENRWWKTLRKLVVVNLHLYSPYMIRRTPYPPPDSCNFDLEPTLMSSYRGILLFQQKPTSWFSPELPLIFYNPLTREQVTLTVPLKTYLFCGFFFHSPTQEYRVLYQFRQDRVVTAAAGGSRYALLGIRSGSFRQIRNSFYPNCHPDISTSPVLSNGSLHWMVSTVIQDDEEYLPMAQRRGLVYGLPIKCSQTIISFGMTSEVFCVIPHPGADDELCRSHRQQKLRHQKEMRLLEMDGKLCLCDGSYYRRKFDIWVMEDYGKKIWAKRYVVRLDKLLPFSRCAADHSVIPWVKAMCIHGNNLVFQWYPWDRRKRYSFCDYMVYDLERGGSLRKFKDHPLRSEASKNYPMELQNLVTHTPSLETTGRKSGCVLSLYEDCNGNSELVEYVYEQS